LSAAGTGFLSKARAPRINATIFAMRQIRPAAPAIRLSQFICPALLTFGRELAAQRARLKRIWRARSWQEFLICGLAQGLLITKK